MVFKVRSHHVGELDRKCRIASCIAAQHSPRMPMTSVILARSWSGINPACASGLPTAESSAVELNSVERALLVINISRLHMRLDQSVFQQRDVKHGRTVKCLLGIRDAGLRPPHLQ